ncbi:MAG: DNA translocase FtsK [Chloroflexi bacterium]|nr:DNA translocase FtsK [Chloroflexota bacterium]
MAKKTQPGSQTSQAAGQPASLLYVGVAAVVILVAALGGAAYWFRSPISDFFVSIKDAIISTLGLGVMPIVLWLAVLVFALILRRAWFRRVNFWLSSVALVALIMGVMAFFQPVQGALAFFTLNGDVSLGGNVGEAVIGSVAWLGVLRLIGLLIVGVSIAAPPLAADAGVALGRLAIYAYVMLIVAVRAIATMYRFDKSSQTPERDAVTIPTEQTAPDMPNEALLPYLRPSNASDVGAGTHADSPILKPYAPQPANDLPSIAPTAYSPPVARDVVEADKDYDSEGQEAVEYVNGEAAVAETASPVSEATPRYPSSGVKFNSLWGTFDSGDGDESENGADEQGLASAAVANGSLASGWTLPSTDFLLEIPEGGITEEEVRATSEIIQQTLADYNIEVEIGQVKPGPRVTMYGLIPGWVRRHKQVKETDEQGNPVLDESGKPVMVREENNTRVKVDSILSREKDLSLALKTPSIRIETPVMGQSLLGIEVPNPNADVVGLRSVMESAEFGRLRPKADLPVALGKGSGGETVVIDLAKMPHLLIAGATGSGKSACLNSIISCLVMEKTPAEMRLLLIDPKRVELTPYNGVPHLLTPVIVETDQVVGYLKGLIREMLDRYRRMEEVSVRNIEAYNNRMPEKMPLLVVVIDELADLMMSAAFDVEQSLCRLAQLGRATGIHLVVATQRPSVDVVTGLIKANFPSRISFGVTSQVDSRTILDTAGADKLLGRGDMLYLPLDASRPERVQGVFISDGEIESLVKFWQTTPWASLPSISLRSIAEEDDEQDEFDNSSTDELLEKAVDMAQTHSKLSTSLLQRRLRIGYPRAARLMDELEDRGIVGPSDGSKSRDVIMS